jgi:hypothetical protein
VSNERLKDNPVTQVRGPDGRVKPMSEVLPEKKPDGAEEQKPKS